MQGERWAYFPAVDMLRGVAVLAVLLSHGPTMIGMDSGIARAVALPALGVGVDLFFVISGFVSVHAYLRAKEAARGWRGELLFWARRLARLAPLAWCVAGLLAIGVLVQSGASGADLRAAFSFTGNVHWARCWAGVSNDCGNPNWLGHFWSLGLELQFYLVLPALMLVPVRWLRLAVFLACMVGMFTWRPWGGALWAFRPEAFLLGTLTAREGADSWLRSFAREMHPLGVIEASAWLLIAAMTARLLDPFAPGVGLVLVALIGAYLVARAAALGDDLTRLGEGMRWLGLRSYGVYLVHPAMLAIAGWGLASNYGFAVALVAGAVVAVGIAAWLYREVEQPARKRLAAICEIALLPKSDRRGDELETAR